MDLYRAGGIRGLYTGFRLHAMRDTLVRRFLFAAFVCNAEDRNWDLQGTGFYFGMYDALQLAIQRNADRIGNPPTIVTTFACGSA